MENIISKEINKVKKKNIINKNKQNLNFLSLFNVNNSIINTKYIIIFIIITLNYFLTIILIYSSKNNKQTIFNINLHINNEITKLNNFILICKKGKLIKNIPNFYIHPIITAVIILYNSQKTITTSIRSIQNQNMSDFELLLIDDYSTDNSLKIIEKFEKEDNRIRIIRNKENKGALYSRSIGTLKARGKYIMALDSDDLFINGNIFNICYKEAELYHLDIVEFAGFHIKKPLLKKSNKFPKKAYYLRFKPYNKIIKQPMLFNYLYKKNKTRIIRLIDAYIWGKCIKKQTYIKALNKLGKNIYTQKLNFGEDRIVNFVLFQVAQSFKYINEYGIIYYNNPYSIYNSYNKELILHDELINLMSIYNFTKNSTFLNILSYEIIFRWEPVIKPGLNEKYKNDIKFLINFLLKSKYIEDNDKNIMLLYLNDLN